MHQPPLPTMEYSQPSLLLSKGGLCSKKGQVPLELMVAISRGARRRQKDRDSKIVRFSTPPISVRFLHQLIGTKYYPTSCPSLLITPRSLCGIKSTQALIRRCGTNACPKHVTVTSPHYLHFIAPRRRVVWCARKKSGLADSICRGHTSISCTLCLLRLFRTASQPSSTRSLLV